MLFDKLLAEAEDNERLRLSAEAERITRNVAYIKADIAFPAELPDLPAGSKVGLQTYGLSITLPKGSNPRPWIDCLTDVGFKPSDHNPHQYCHCWQEQIEDETGHSLQKWHYSLCCISVEA